MIYLAVLFASLCVLGVGIIVGYHLHDTDDDYWSGYRDALHALGWLHEGVMR